MYKVYETFISVPGLDLGTVGLEPSTVSHQTIYFRKSGIISVVHPEIFDTSSARALQTDSDNLHLGQCVISSDNYVDIDYNTLSLLLSPGVEEGTNSVWGWQKWI